MKGDRKKLTTDELAKHLDALTKVSGKSNFDAGSLTKETKEALDSLESSSDNAEDSRSQYEALKKSLTQNRDALIANLKNLPPEIRERITALLGDEKKAREEGNLEAHLDSLFACDQAFKEHASVEKKVARRKSPVQKKQEKIRSILFVLKALLPAEQQTTVAALMDDFQNSQQSPQADVKNLQQCMALFKKMSPRVKKIIGQTIAIRDARREHKLSAHLGALTKTFAVKEIGALPAQIRSLNALVDFCQRQRKIYQEREHQIANPQENITLSTEVTNPRVLQAIVEAENKKLLAAQQTLGSGKQNQPVSKLECQTFREGGKPVVMVSDSQGNAIYTQLADGTRYINPTSMETAANILAAEHAHHEQTKKTARNYYHDGVPDNKAKAFDEALMKRNITAEHFMNRIEGKVIYTYPDAAGKALLAKRQVAQMAAGAY